MAAYAAGSALPSAHAAGVCVSLHRLLPDSAATETRRGSRAAHRPLPGEGVDETCDSRAAEQEEAESGGGRAGGGAGEENQQHAATQQLMRAAAADGERATASTVHTWR